MSFGGMATPLGMKPGTSQRGVPPLWRWGMLALFLLCLIILLAVTSRKGAAPEQRPGVVAVIERVSAETRPAADRAPANEIHRPRSDAAEIEAGSGVKVIRQNGGGSATGVVIRVPDSASSPEARGGSGPDPRVGERSQLGILPRIGDGNLLPRNVYARAFTPSGKPMIGIVMTGVGIGARGTADAISKLPGEVTLAFAPYGRDLEQQVQRARRDGHEIVLQIPMEPVDYPDSDPGPHTLKSDSTTRENIERLHWLMSRFTGYVGVANFMGGKLMATQGPYGNLLEEINRRGLLFLDDGTTGNSRTLDHGAKLGLPVRIADRVFETGGTASLSALLADVESIAKAKGSAVITVPALPANIAVIAQWERDLATRGLVLAPLSAIMARSAR